MLYYLDGQAEWSPACSRGTSISSSIERDDEMGPSDRAATQLAAAAGESHQPSLRSPLPPARVGRSAATTSTVQYYPSPIDIWCELRSFSPQKEVERAGGTTYFTPPTLAWGEKLFFYDSQKVS